MTSAVSMASVNRPFYSVAAEVFRYGNWLEAIQGDGAELPSLNDQEDLDPRTGYCADDRKKPEACTEAGAGDCAGPGYKDSSPGRPAASQYQQFGSSLSSVQNARMIVRFMIAWSVWQCGLPGFG